MFVLCVFIRSVCSQIVHTWVIQLIPELLPSTSDKLNVDVFNICIKKLDTYNLFLTKWQLFELSIVSSPEPKAHKVSL